MSLPTPDSRLLLLMRHGKAEAGSGAMDHERELAEKGEGQARLVGEYLAAQGARVTRVLVSDAVRTRRTWEQVLAQLPGFDGAVTHHEVIYTGGAEDVLELLRGVEDEHRVVMVVGHEPTTSTLTTRLAGEDSDAGAVAQARIGMPTGGLAVLTGDGTGWSGLVEDALTLHTIVRP